jgi:hypothetical protein
VILAILPALAVRLGLLWYRVHWAGTPGKVEWVNYFPPVAQFGGEGLPELHVKLETLVAVVVAHGSRCCLSDRSRGGSGSFRGLGYRHTLRWGSRNNDHS